MKIMKVIFEESCELPNYDELEELGVIHNTDYNTVEISAGSVREGRGNSDDETEFENMLCENLGTDVVELLMSEQVDIIMLV